MHRYGLEMGNILIDIIAFLLRIIFELLFTWTGEVLLFLVTMGWHKPRWDFYMSESPFRFVIFSEISFWIGVAFWLTVAAISFKGLFKNKIDISFRTWQYAEHGKH